MRQTAAIERTWYLLSLILAVGVVGVAACSSDASKATGTTTTLAGGAVTIAVDGATTTVADGATTTGAASDVATTVTVAPTTTTVAGTSTPARNIPTAWVAGAQPGDPVVIAAAGVCDPFYVGLAAGPYTASRCGMWNASDGQRTWTVTRGALGSLIAIIWQQTAPNTWVPVLRAQETTPGQWSGFTILTGNTDSGPADELVSGVRILGVHEKLAIAVIDIRAGNPRVVAVHPTGNNGVALLRSGVGIEVWSGVEAAGDPACCPTNFAQTFLVSVDGGWVINSGVTVPAGDPAIPISEF